MNDGEEIQLRASQLAVALRDRHKQARDAKPSLEQLLTGLKAGLQHVASQVPQVEDCLSIDLLENSVLCRLSTILSGSAAVLKSPWDDYPPFELHVSNGGQIYRKICDGEGKETSRIPISLREMHEHFKEWIADWIVIIYPSLSEADEGEAASASVPMTAQSYYFLVLILALVGGYFLIAYT